MYRRTSTQEVRLVIWSLFVFAALLIILLLFAPSAHSQEVDPKCKWIQTPWGGSRCDVTPECSLTLMPMHIDNSTETLYVSLITDETTVVRESVVPIEEGAGTAEIIFDQPLKWAEWYIRSSNDAVGPTVPQYACYCDEKRDVIVICVQGQVSKEIE